MNTREGLEKEVNQYNEFYNQSTCKDKYYGLLYRGPNNLFEKCLTLPQPEECKDRVFEGYLKCRETFQLNWLDTQKELEKSALRHIDSRHEEIVSRVKEKFYGAPTFWTHFQWNHRSQCSTLPPEAEKKCADNIYSKYKQSIHPDSAQYAKSQKNLEDYHVFSKKIQKENNDSKGNAKRYKRELFHTTRCREEFYMEYRRKGFNKLGKFAQCHTQPNRQECENEVYKNYEACLKRFK